MRTPPFEMDRAGSAALTGRVLLGAGFPMALPWAVDELPLTGRWKRQLGFASLPRKEQLTQSPWQTDEFRFAIKTVTKGVMLPTAWQPER